MRLFSATEYELGFIAVGGAPIGIISIGTAPVGVIAIGVMPLGLVSIACGVGLGLRSYSCGVGLGARVRAVGLAVGGDARAVGANVAIGGDKPMPGSSRNERLRYWIGLACCGLATLAAFLLIAGERFAITRMTHVVTTRWEAHSHDSEGLFIAPDRSCHVGATLRSDGTKRIHADIEVVCGSLRLVGRHIRRGCTVGQAPDGNGYAYTLRCNAARIPATSGDEDTEATPEVPGLEIDTTQSPGRARVYANGPPPMSVSLELEEYSQPVDGQPLLTKGKSKLTGQLGSDAIARLFE
jgi:hypothetical protein